MKYQNPLSFVWKFFSVSSGIIGIASLTESVIAWKNFIPKIIDAYQSFIYFPFKFFDFNIPYLLIDYFFIGSICGTSYVRAINFGEKNGLLSSNGSPKSVRFFYFVLYLFFWPLGLIISLKQIFFKDENIVERKIKSNFIHWICALLFGFLIVLIANDFL